MGSTPNQQVRDRLTQNAVDFLLKAAEELENSPRYALVHLCAGLELLLKGRLAHEHWSLVLEKPGTNAFGELEQGNFKSVAFKEALDRIAKVCGPAWSERDRTLLLNVSDHRNRVVHFYHAGLDGGDESLRAQVAADQCRAWAVFRRLVEGPWNDALPLLASRLETLHTAFAQSRDYLLVRFEELGPRLESLRTEGKRIDKCAACELAALLVDEQPFQVEDADCLVCGGGHLAVHFTCPGCSQPFVTVPDDKVRCRCGRDLLLSEMCKQLGLDAGSGCNCWICTPYMGSGSAYSSNDGSRHFCMACMQTYSEQPKPCVGCGTEWVGCDEESLTQCPLCAKWGPARPGFPYRG